MSVNNNGFNVVISGINTLSNFTATNIKIQDTCVYTITNNAKGNDTNGFIVRLTNNISSNRDNGYYIPIMVINNGNFKTVRMNTSKISLSLPKHTELEVDLSVDAITSVMSAINSSLNNNFNFVHDKLTSVDNKLVSLGTINEKITEIKTSTRKKEGTKLS